MPRKLEMDMTSGGLFKKIVVYAVPLILANWLQLLFNAADVMVVGKFVGDNAVAAVSSNTSLINLIIGLFIGVSVGSNVMVARSIGENNAERVKRFVGLSVVLSIGVGVVLLIVGVLCARTFLTWMGCDPAVIEMATKYLTIYCIGLPVIMLYNFCSAILRAAGDTLRPLIFLVVAGVINVVLNIVLVTAFGMDVDGVAIATVVSQGVSALLCVIVLAKNKGICNLSFKYMRIYGKELKEIIHIGIPSGIGSCMFHLSNVVIQSTINSFGAAAMSGNGYAQQLEGFVYHAMYGFALTVTSFVSQNLGAGKIDRIKRATKQCVALAVGFGIIFGGIFLLLAKPLLGYLAHDPQVVDIAVNRLLIIFPIYFLCGIMDNLSHALRGLGKSVSVMIVSLAGACLFRILWIKTVFLLSPTLLTVYLSYPISWLLTLTVYIIWIVLYIKKLERTCGDTKAETPAESSTATAVETKAETPADSSVRG